MCISLKYQKDSYMITPVLLLSVLICALVAGFIAFFVLLPRKKDDNRFSKISAIATFMASVATIAVGIATVSVMTHEEIRDKLQNQPLYSVSISANYSTEKLAFDNEEFEINNEGKKTREKTEVRHYSILELTYTDTNKHAAPKTRFCLLDDYFGASIYTGNLDGTIEYSAYSGNNWELFVDFSRKANNYGETHPGIIVAVEKRHYFDLLYTDIFGDKHRIVKTKNSEIDPEKLVEILKKAQTDASGISFSIRNLDLDFILRTCFPEEF